MERIKKTASSRTRRVPCLLPISAAAFFLCFPLSAGNVYASAVDGLAQENYQEILPDGAPTGNTQDPMQDIPPEGSTQDPAQDISPEGNIQDSLDDTPPGSSVQPQPPISKEETITVQASVSQKKNKKYAYISWKAAKGAATYKIQRSTNPGGNYTTLTVLGDNGKKFTDTHVKRGTRYWYRVAAYKKDGTVFYSDAMPFECPLGKVTGVRLVRYSASSVKVLWDQNTDAKYYKIFCSKTKSGKYTQLGTTQNTWYRAEGLSSNQNYYFKVQACASKKASGLDADASSAAQIKTTPYERTTIFAGDSLTAGLLSYNILNEIGIGGKKDVVAEVGLNTTTFRTKRVFNGKSGLEAVVSAKPYRVYLMLGVNEIHYRSADDVIAGYKEILKGIQQGSPGTDIVVLAASPVTSAELASRPGFGQIPDLNKKLKSLASTMGIKFYDYSSFLKDSKGCLKKEYAAKDGFHWQPSAYHIFADQIEAYDKKLD